MPKITPKQAKTGQKGVFFVHFGANFAYMGVKGGFLRIFWVPSPKYGDNGVKLDVISPFYAKIYPFYAQIITIITKLVILCSLLGAQMQIWGEWGHFGRKCTHFGNIWTHFDDIWQYLDTFGSFWTLFVHILDPICKYGGKGAILDVNRIKL